MIIMNKKYFSTNSCFLSSSGLLINSLLLGVIIVVLFFINYNADWILGDDIEWLVSTAIGKIEPMSRHAFANGRLFPLGHYDFNILTLIPGGHTAKAHYIYLSLWFVVYAFFMIKLLFDISDSLFGGKRCIAAFTFLFFFFGSNTIHVFLNLIFSEKSIITLLTVIMFLMYRYEKTHKAILLLVASLLAVWTTYCKETVFVIFLIMGLMYIYYSRSKNKIQKYFGVFLVLNSIVFLCIYYLFKESGSTYTVAPNKQLYYTLFLFSPHVYLSFLIVIWRLWGVVVKKRPVALFFDATLLSAVAYSSAFLTLQYSYDYYYLPSLVLSIPTYLLLIGEIVTKKRNNVTQMSVLLFLCMVFIRPLHLFPYLIKNNQNRRKTEMNAVRMSLPSVGKEGEIYFVDTKFPHKDFSYNANIWKKQVIPTFLGYELKRTVFVESVSVYNALNCDYVFLTREEESHLNSKEKRHIDLHFKKVIKLGDLECFLLQNNKQCKANIPSQKRYHQE